MSAWVETALVGTGRRERLPELDEILEEVPIDESGERTWRFLLEAGVRTVWRSAGQKGSPGSLPEPAPRDQRVRCSESAGELVLHLAGNSVGRPLLGEACRRLVRRGERLPPHLLPSILAIRSREIRAVVRPVLGPRAVWLGQFHDRWSWVVPETDPTIWDEGRPAERRRWLRWCRGEEPARARRHVEEVWSSDKADRRLDWIRTFEEGLSLEDEPFLQRCLDADRSRRVRGVARELLKRLPRSEFVMRMVRRADPILELEPGGRLAVHPPSAPDKEASLDGVLGEPPSGEGRQAYWIRTILSIVPVEHWTRRFGVGPGVLCRGARRGDWARPVLEGWTEAAIRNESDSWMPDLYDAWMKLTAEGTSRDDIQERLERLLAGMPVTAGEARIVRLLRGEDGPPLRVDRLLVAARRPWHEDAAREVLSLLLSDDRRVQRVLHVLDDVALALPEKVLEDALEETASRQGENWERFRDRLRLRQRLARELPT